tara:strand:- start:150 stop:380 length:231 start_codon:yes stop_codon:yes gene_type:complete
MNKKGLDAEVYLEETPNLQTTADKPSKSSENLNRRVDINVLKARAKAIQDKENTKNTVIIILFLFTLGAVGIFLSI